MKNVLVILTVLIGAVTAQAFDIEQCLKEEGDNMSGMKMCAYQEYQAQDEKMNAIYKELKTLLTAKAEEEKKDEYGIPHYQEILVRLVAAQDAWIPFRDAECLLKAESIGGSMEGLEIAGCSTTMTKERAEFLAKLLENNK